MQVTFKDKITEKMGLDVAIQSLIGENVLYAFVRESDQDKTDKMYPNKSKTYLKQIALAYANAIDMKKVEDFTIASLFTISGAKLYEAGATGFIFGADLQKDFIFAVVQ